MKEIYHALVLNMHQPPSNLDELLVTNEWEVKEILFAYDRMPRTLWGYEDIARVHLSLSGTLLETLSNPDWLIVGFEDILPAATECPRAIPIRPDRGA